MERSETELMLSGYGLTTAEMFYHLPDYVHVLNSFTWQDYDIAPDYPRLLEFIDFWRYSGSTQCRKDECNCYNGNDS